MNRRDFFIRMGGAALAVPAVLHVGACGLFDSDDPVDEPDANNNPDAPPGSACVNDASVTIDNPHNHEMVVTVADVEAGVEKTYDIQGTSPHPHTVVLTAAHFQMLADGQTVMVTSSNDSAHDHLVTIVCA